MLERKLVDQLFPASSTAHTQTLYLILCILCLVPLYPQAVDSDPQGSSLVGSQGHGVKCQLDEVAIEAVEDHQDGTCEEQVRIKHMGLKYLGLVHSYLTIGLQSVES